MNGKESRYLLLTGKAGLKGFNKMVRNMMNEDRVRINDLKDALRSGRESIMDLINQMTSNPEGETPEQREERNKKLRGEVALKKALMIGHKKELQIAKMNKNGSSSFSWEPHNIGMNRTQARRFRRQNKKK